MDADKLEKMLIQVALGAPAPLHESDADAAMRAKLTRECAEIRRQGLTIDIPGEMA